MGILVLVLLVAAWGLVLGPALLKNVSDPSPVRTEMMFQKTLRAIGGPRRPRAVAGRIILAPKSSDYPLSPIMSRVAILNDTGTASARRRRNLTFLAGFIIVTFLLGWLISPLRFVLYINFVADLVFVAYLAAAVFIANQQPVRTRAEQSSGGDMVPREVAGGI